MISLADPAPGSSPDSPLVKGFVLTKRAFLELPAGLFLASNCGYPPVFAEYVTDDRLSQWSRIKLARAHGRLCYTFRSRLGYEQWFAQLHF